jgi:hypothetical protein
MKPKRPSELLPQDSWWWRNLKYATYGKSPGKGAVAGVVRPSPADPEEGLDDRFSRAIWARGWRRKELAAWRYEVVRRVYPHKDRVPFPDLRALISGSLVTELGELDTREPYQWPGPGRPSEGYTACNWYFDLTASDRDLAKGFRHWVRSQRAKLKQEPGADPAPAKKFRRTPISWAWLEIYDRHATGETLTETESRTLLKLRAEASEFLGRVESVFATYGFLLKHK